MSTRLPQPFYLGEPGERCFAQLWQPTEAPCGATLLCLPWGREGIQTQRNFNHLAQALVAEGQVVLRIDLPGSGASEGDDLQGERLSVWLRALGLATDWLKAHTGAHQVNWGGLRTSASLMWHLAAQRTDVHTLVALAPVTKGRLFVREQTMLQASTPAHLRAHDASVIEATGYPINAATQQAWSQIDLLAQATPPAPRLMVYHRDDMPTDNRWVQHLAALAANGAEVGQGSLPDYRMLMLESCTTPDALYQDIARQLRSPDRLAGPIPQGQLQPLQALQTPASRPQTEETAFYLPGSSPLFGVVHRPLRSAPSGRAILMLNEGANSAVGPQRMWLELARQWSARGDTILRLDLSGLADSPAREGEDERMIYSNVVEDDLAQALAWLHEQADVQEVTVMGLCSGAYHGFLAAARGLPVQHVVMINPLVYHWEQGMSWDEVDVSLHQRDRVSQQTAAAFKPDKWAKLLKGDIGWDRVSQFVRARAKTSAVSARDWLADRLGWQLPTRLAWRLGRMQRRGVRVDFLFAKGELGLTKLFDEGQRALRNGLDGGAFRLHVIEGGNHVFSDSEPRQRLMQTLDSLFHPEQANATVTAGTEPLAQARV